MEKFEFEVKNLYILCGRQTFLSQNGIENEKSLKSAGLEQGFAPLIIC